MSAHCRRGRSLVHPREWYASHWQEHRAVHTARRGLFCCAVPSLFSFSVASHE